MNNAVLNKDIIISDFKNAENLITLLSLTHYTQKHDIFTIRILNKNIILYNEKLSLPTIKALIKKELKPFETLQDL